MPIGEADGVCVVMAEQRAGYILGQDSDFVILVGEGGRGRGYIPLDMVQWIEGDEQSQNLDPDVDMGMDGGGRRKTEWMTTTPRKQPPTRQSYLLPSLDYSNPTLILVVYPPQALRQRLRLPASVLPLFASLCGNDYTPPTAGEHFFESGLSTVQKIDKVARVLREQLFSPSASRAASAGDTAVELVTRVIKRLSVTARTFNTEQEVQTLVEAIIEATLQYILPSGRDCCPNYPFCGELDAGCSSHSSHAVSPIIEAYANARRRGRSNNVTSLHLYPERIPLWSVLEDPSKASLKAGGLREVRKKAYEIVEQDIGLRWPAPRSEEVEEVGNADQSNEDELKEILGVADNSSEGTLVDVGADGDPRKANATPTPPAHPRIIIEYLRSSSRMIAAPLPLSPLEEQAQSKIPTCLLPLPRRLEIYLAAFQSATPAILALPIHLHPFIACLRFSIIDLYPRDPLRRHEVEALLKSGIATYSSWKREYRGDTTSKKELEVAYPQLANRNSQILAMIKAVMTDSIILAQALLLTDPIEDESPPRVDGDVTHLKPFMFFSGSMAHILLSGDLPPVWKWTEPDQSAYDQCLPALVEGIEDSILGWKGSPGTKSGQLHQSNASKDGEPNKPGGAGGKYAPPQGKHGAMRGGSHGQTGSPRDSRYGHGQQHRGGHRGGSGGRGGKQMGSRFGLLDGMTS